MNEFFKEINSLRAFACISVILSHNFFPLPYKEFGAAGVILFFVISGFIISHSLQPYVAYEGERNKFLDVLDNLQNISSANMHNIRTFLLRRIYRIFPCLIFLFVLALFSLPLMATAYGFGLAEGVIGYIRQVSNIFLGTLTFYLNQFPVLLEFHKFNFHFQTAACWTLVVEFFFYLFFPFFLLFVKRRRAQAILIIIGGHIIRVVGMQISPESGYNLVFSNFDAFFMGVFVYLLVSEKPRLKENKKIIIFFSILSFFVLTFYPFKYPSLYFSHIFTNYIIASGILVYVAALNTGLLMPKVLSPLLSYIGNRSYVMYLYHLLFSFLFEQVVFLEKLKYNYHTAIIYYILKISMFILVVELIYHFIEQHFIKIARKKFPYKKFDVICPQGKIATSL